MLRPLSKSWPTLLENGAVETTLQVVKQNSGAHTKTTKSSNVNIDH